MSRENCDHGIEVDATCPECEYSGNHGWIKPNEFKPREGRALLLYTTDLDGSRRIIAIGSYAQGKFFSQGHQEYPTHWQYLPEPPIH